MRAAAHGAAVGRVGGWNRLAEDEIAHLLLADTQFIAHDTARPWSAVVERAAAAVPAHAAAAAADHRSLLRFC